ncbi:recombination protein [Synechococcus phage BUCT-ZZ01]|nr:recombination protein [Synechococcus phage BUCT-ZZ01]
MAFLNMSDDYTPEESTQTKKKPSLMDKMMKAGSVKYSSVLSKSTFFGKKDFIKTIIPALNVAYSGELDGGVVPGLTVLAGPSKHFKSNMGLIGVSAYLKKYPDAICLFYDSEFGITPEYLAAQDVDPDRVLHVPIMHIEELKFDVTKRLDEVERGDHMIIFIDSIGNLASKKETEDALEGKSVADMSRAKALKSLFRIMTPQLTAKDIPCIAINHTYQEIGLYPKAIVSGGTGIYYSASAIFIIGRQQEKGADGEIDGYNFIINIEKSRYVKEKAKIPVSVTYAGGVSQYSGILDWGMAGNFIAKPANGWYQELDKDTGEFVGQKYRLKDIEPLLEKTLNKPEFAEFVKNKFKLIGNHTEAEIEEQDIDAEIDD